jgi:Bacteriophage lambda head decoration protein D
MTLIATEAKRLSNVVKQEQWPEAGFCRLAVTYNGTAATLVPGTVLGKVTADGKYKIAVQTATDGSEVAAAIVMQEQTVAATTDTKVLCLVKGPAIVSKDGLVLDASYNLDAEKAAVYAALEAKDINCNDAV